MTGCPKAATTTAQQHRPHPPARPGPHGAQTAGHVRFAADARELWHDAYHRLAIPQPGVLGQITARAEAHDIRLALLYALADDHQKHRPAAPNGRARAARLRRPLCRLALTGATGHTLAEQIHAALKASPTGLTRSQISDTLKHNQPAGQLDHALRALQTAGRATVTQIATGGRLAQLWTTTTAPPERPTSSFVPHPSMPPRSSTTMPETNGAQHHEQLLVDGYRNATLVWGLAAPRPDRTSNGRGNIGLVRWADIAIQ